jgi:hypothetical protein
LISYTTIQFEGDILEVWEVKSKPFEIFYFTLDF